MDASSTGCGATPISTYACCIVRGLAKRERTVGDTSPGPSFATSASGTLRWTPPEGPARGSGWRETGSGSGASFTLGW